MAILTFKNDYSSDVTLDSVLMGVPDSGEYWNVGTHPIVTINNILAYLPIDDITPSDYAAGTTYSTGDLVLSSAVMYESLVDSNTGNTPASSPTQWLSTNSDSQKVKRFLLDVEANAKTALKLDRKLIENQYVYHIAKSDYTPSVDYIGWAFEHKNSDYVVLRINKWAFQANTTDEITFSVINNGAVVSTFTYTPQNGKFAFESENVTLSGFGTFYIVTDAQSIKTDGEVNDPLKYKGLVCYPVYGTGDTAASATYYNTASGNGIGFNISAYADTSSFITHNAIDFIEVYKWQLAYDLVQMMLYNPNTNANRDERNHTGYNRDLMIMESKDEKLNTITKNYKLKVKEAREAISKSFDSILKYNDTNIKVKHGTI